MISSTETSEKPEALTQPENFVAFLGHDLRSHLTAIIGFSRLLQRRAQLEPKYQEYIEKILIAADQQLMLINSVVDLAKSASNTLQLQLEPVDLTALLTSVSDSLKRQVEAKGLQLNTQWPGLSSLLELDERRLHQVLMQLLNNAIRYTEQGEVSLNVEKNGDRFCFSIKDTGPGLSAERIEQLLNALPPVPQAQGSGLGIPLSRALLELMGTSLAIDSQPGAGSCFRFELRLPEVATGGTYQSANPALEPGPVSRSASATLPLETINTLTDLALQGDIKGIIDQAELLTHYHGGKFAGFATELTSLAKSFQINKICELLTAMKSQA